MKAKVTVTPMKKSNKAQHSKNNSPKQCEECGKKFFAHWKPSEAQGVQDLHYQNSAIKSGT